MSSNVKDSAVSCGTTAQARSKSLGIPKSSAKPNSDGPKVVDEVNLDHEVFRVAKEGIILHRVEAVVSYFAV